MIFFWRDKLINNIEQWAYERGEKMFDITFKIKDVNPYAKKNKITYYKETRSMPESFWNTLRMNTKDGVPVKIKKREPRI